MKNSLIKASAGTGKTFALASRMIRLLLVDVDPCHIVALTFSRAAAGEIFNRIAGRLADAAATDAGATIESAHIYREIGTDLATLIRNRHGNPIARPIFAALLRRLIATQHISMIGTIDSFMTRMVQAFPLELGLQGRLTIMDDYRVQREKNHAISALLNRLAGTDETELFSEAFRQATFGREGKTFGQKLGDFTETWQGHYLDYPDRQAWGQPATIWPDKFPFRIHDTLEHLADQLASAIRSDWEKVKLENKWDEFCEFVLRFNTSFPSSTIVQNVLRACAPGTTSLEIKFNRTTLAFSDAKARLIRQTVETLYGLTLRARCQTTQGLYTLMRQIDAVYAQNTRNRGLLTFDDIPRLIADLDLSTRQNIEYRFDSRFGHWALDEFQDTSHVQWQAIRNLVDELIQSDSGERSLFIVGDTKQAIYGWRGGDVSIFEREVDSGHYQIEDLSVSYRYCPQIADLINRVFDGKQIRDLLKANAPEAGNRWNRLWHPHTSRQPDGLVHVERIPSPDKSNNETEIDVYLKTAVQHFQALRPWEHGLSSAILVRNNQQGPLFAEALRRAGLPAVWEGESAICDTPAVTALLHLLHVAEHPGDSLAWQHVCASPLARTIFREACAQPQEHGAAMLSRRVLNDVSRLGLPRTLHTYMQDLASIESNAFTRARFDELLRAAAQFADDADAETTLTDFAAFVSAFKTRSTADTSTIKILTIHRSKGLGFDLVLLPISENTGIDTARADDVLFGTDGRWLLTNPGKQVTQADATLAHARSTANAEAVFESLCVHYVAMTRAKRALILLLKPASQRGTDSRYLSDHIERTLGTVLPYTAGTLKRTESEQPAPTETGPTPMPLPPRPKRRHIRRLTPSSTVYHGHLASDLFVPHNEDVRQRGTRLHEALSRVEWLDPTTPQPADIETNDLDLTRPSAFRNALMCPAGLTDLWRERAFELIVGDEWISGTFDRVVFSKKDGAPCAEIVDFKSNRRPPNESDHTFAERMRKTYTAQMSSYRQALARLTRLPPHAIACTLLLTDTLQAVPVPDTEGTS